MPAPGSHTDTGTTDRRNTDDVHPFVQPSDANKPPSTQPVLTDDFPKAKTSVDAPLPSSASQVPTMTDAKSLVVDWDGADDPRNPKNWRSSKKWSVAMTMSLFALISTLSSSMVAPAAFQIAAQLDISAEVEVSMTISIFVLAYAVGPLFLGPLSEIYGRVIVLQLANMSFLAFTIACAFAQTKGQFIAFRFLAGLGGSAPLSVGGGVLADLWDANERGKAVGVYSLAPLLGPVIGPITGGFVAEYSTWRWVFRAISITDGLVQVVGFLLLKETYAPILLKRKAKRIIAQMDAEKGGENIVVQTVYEKKQAGKTFKEWIIHSLVRPFSIFFQEPIIQLFGAYLAFVYGVLYLVLTTLPRIYTSIYHQKIGVVGLHYIPLGLGLISAAQVNSILIDRTYRILTKRNGVGKPEYRLLPVFPGTLCLPIGLFIGGWTAQSHTHWIGPDIGFYFLGVGSASVFQGVQSYVIDCFPQYAASALAAVSCFRSLAGFGFPLFAPYMYDALGYGKGDTILAAFCLGIGTPALILFWLYGEKIRGLSKRARSGTHADSAVTPAPQVVTKSA